MSKPKEFWLLKADDDGPMTRPGPDWYVCTSRPNNTEAIHVIEKSAYDIQCRDNTSLLNALSDAVGKGQELEAKLKIAVDALHVIGPLARDNGNGETEYKSDAYGFIFKKVKETLDKIQQVEAVSEDKK